MKDVTLVVLAAGLSNRYGGQKQLDPMGPGGEIIIDYSVYDAVKVGFTKIVFIIKEENHALFQKAIGEKIARFVKVQYVFQKMDILPTGCEVIAGREKPWGTTQAILCCKGAVNEDFMVINADDFYGRSAFSEVYDFLQGRDCSNETIHCCMAGFQIDKTLTENGHVTRGVCSVTDDGFLESIVERTQVQLVGGKVCFSEDDGKTFTALPSDTPVSMNCWGFGVEMIGHMEGSLRHFFETSVNENPLTAECCLPNTVGELLRLGACDVEVRNTSDGWFGVTYAADKAFAAAKISEAIADGRYPSKLWE